MPPMMTGVFTGDVDDLGNTINEYIYSYKWDYTRDQYFNRGSIIIWRAAPLAEKVYKMVEMGRYIGVERLWVDDFWFDAKGNWKGIFGDDWPHIADYIRRNGMVFRLWMPPWHADRLSDVWLRAPGVDAGLSRQLVQLDDRHVARGGLPVGPRHALRHAGADRHL